MFYRRIAPLVLVALLIVTAGLALAADPTPTATVAPVSAPLPTNIQSWFVKWFTTLPTFHETLSDGLQVQLTWHEDNRTMHDVLIYNTPLMLQTCMYDADNECVIKTIMTYGSDALVAFINHAKSASAVKVNIEWAMSQDSLPPNVTIAAATFEQQFSVNSDTTWKTYPAIAGVTYTVSPENEAAYERSVTFSDSDISDWFRPILSLAFES